LGRITKLASAKCKLLHTMWNREIAGSAIVYFRFNQYYTWSDRTVVPGLTVEVTVAGKLGAVMADFNAARQNMVASQIRTNKVTDPKLLSALAETPREGFLPSRLREIAYVDEDLAIGGGRYLMEPMVLARMIQALDLDADDVVLDIGCAFGYSSAVLARLATAVVAVECDASLAREATIKFAEIGVDNVVVVEEEELSNGHKEQAPYQAIFLNGAVPEVPEELIGQLAEGGRLCAVIDSGTGAGQAIRTVRHGTTVATRVLFDANVPPLPGFDRETGFVF